MAEAAMKEQNEDQNNFFKDLGATVEMNTR